MQHNPTINLLKSKQTGFFDKFIDWMLTTGRLVVIVTELIALSAFLYRFSLDKKLIDLHSKIKQEQAVLTSLRDKEEAYRNLQDRLALASSLSKSSEKTLKIFQDITALAQNGVKFNTLTISTNIIKIGLNVPSTSSLTKFVNSLKEDRNIERINLDSIDVRQDSSLIVSITANLK